MYTFIQRANWFELLYCDNFHFPYSIAYILITEPAGRSWTDFAAYKGRQHQIIIHLFSMRQLSCWLINYDWPVCRLDIDAVGSAGLTGHVDVFVAFFGCFSNILCEGKNSWKISMFIAFLPLGDFSQKNLWTNKPSCCFFIRASLTGFYFFNKVHEPTNRRISTKTRWKWW